MTPTPGTEAAHPRPTKTTRVNTPGPRILTENREVGFLHNGIAEWLPARAIEKRHGWARACFASGLMSRAFSSPEPCALRYRLSVSGDRARTRRQGTAGRRAVFPLYTRSPPVAGRQTEVTDALLGGGLPGHRDYRGDL